MKTEANDTESSLSRISPIKKLDLLSHDSIFNLKLQSELEIKRADSVLSLGVVKPGLNDSRQSVDRREKIEQGTKDLADKIAALNDNWMSIKKDQLETITEARPITRESLLGGASKSKKLTAAPVQQPIRAGLKDAAKDRKVELAKPTTTLASLSGQGIGLNRVKPATPNIKMANSLSQSAVTGFGPGNQTFDIGRAFEELDSIKNKMTNQTTFSRVPMKLQVDSPSIQTRHLVDVIDPENEDIEELEYAKKDLTAGLASNKTKVDTLAARRAQRTGTTGGKKISVVQKKKMLDDIEAQFMAAFKKVKEFERETGVSVNQNNINREYNKMLDEIREVVKKN